MVLNSPDIVNLSSVVIYDVCSNLGNELLLSVLHPEQIAAQKAAISCLRKAGATIEQLDMSAISEGLNAFSVWSALMDRESPMRFDEIIREGSGPMFYPWELLKCLFGLSIHTPPAMLLAITQRLVAFFPSHTEKLCALAEVFKLQLKNALKTEKSEDGSDIYRAIVMPSLATTAPMHMENLLRIFDTSNTSFFNVMELPVTAVPMGLTFAGLPTGIQIIADHGYDFVSIAIASKLESFGVAGWKPPLQEAFHDFFHNY